MHAFMGVGMGGVRECWYNKPFFVRQWRGLNGVCTRRRKKGKYHIVSTSAQKYATPNATLIASLNFVCLRELSLKIFCRAFVQNIDTVSLEDICADCTEPL